MKGEFDANVPLAKRVQNWIVDQSTACDFTVFDLKIDWNICLGGHTEAELALVHTERPETKVLVRRKNPIPIDDVFSFITTWIFFHPFLQPTQL